MITSTANARIRELVRMKKNSKERSAKDSFLVEGPKMFSEIPPELLREVYVSESYRASMSDGKRGQNRSENTGKRSGAETSFEVVSDSVFQYLSDTKNPQGILAVVKQLHYKVEDLAGESPLIIVLENVQDPGNLGTILRTAEAAGVTGILLSEGCADIYNPKVTRSTMGSIFRVPFVYTGDLPGALAQLQKWGVKLFAAHLQGSEDLYSQDFGGPSAFLIGNESRGLTPQTAALADKAVRIAMSGQVESLNAAVASAVMMFEAKRQRTQAAHSLKG